MYNRIKIHWHRNVKRRLILTRGEKENTQITFQNDTSSCLIYTAQIQCQVLLPGADKAETIQTQTLPSRGPLHQAQVRTKRTPDPAQEAEGVFTRDPLAPGHRGEAWVKDTEGKHHLTFQCNSAPA